MTKATKKEPTKAMKVKILTGADAINTAISSIAKRGKALDKDIHAAAVSCMIHADKHGDITLANKLVDALPASQRKNALRDWFIAFGKFTYNQADKQFTFNKEAVTKTEEATATPFWEFKPEAEYVPLDLSILFDNAIKRVNKAIENGDNIPVGTVEGLTELKLKLVKPDVLAA